MIQKELLSDDIDCIEWSPSNFKHSNNILFGSKKEQIFKIYAVNHATGNKFEPIVEMNLKKNYPSEKLNGVISYSFLPNSSIATVASNKMIIQQYDDSYQDVKSDQIHTFNNNITHFKFMEYTTNNYMVYTDETESFNTQQ